MEDSYISRRRQAEPMVEPPRRRQPKWALIVALLMTAVAIIFAVLYFTKKPADNCGVNNTQSSNDAETTSPASTPAESSNTLANRSLTLTIDRSRGLNAPDDFIYNNLLFTNSFGSGSIDETNQIVHVQFNEDTVTQIWPDVALLDPYFSTEIEFEKAVADVFIGGVGHAAGNEVMFFLMADGTVEYMPLYEALLNDDYTSRGALQNVKDVVRIKQTNVNYQDAVGGHATVVAITSDGSFYDLFQTAELKED